MRPEPLPPPPNDQRPTHQSGRGPDHSRMLLVNEGTSRIRPYHSASPVVGPGHAAGSSRIQHQDAGRALMGLDAQCLSLPLLVPHEHWPMTHLMGLNHSLPICPDPYLDISVQSQAHFFLPWFARYQWLSFSAVVPSWAAFKRLCHWHSIPHLLNQVTAIRQANPNLRALILGA